MARAVLARCGDGDPDRSRAYRGDPRDHPALGAADAVLEGSGADFGLADIPLVLKLELLQHAGSFKPGARSPTSCCGRSPPPAWWRRRGETTGPRWRMPRCGSACRAKIFVPTVASPAKIRGSASTAPTSSSAVTATRTPWRRARRGARVRRAGGARLRPARDAPRPGERRPRARGPGPVTRHGAGGGRRRRADRRHRGLVRGAGKGRRRRARGGADAHAGAPGGAAGRCGGRGASPPTRWRRAGSASYVPPRPGVRRSGGPGQRCGDPPRPGGALGVGAGGGRARRRGGARRPSPGDTCRRPGSGSASCSAAPTRRRWSSAAERTPRWRSSPT